MQRIQTPSLTTRYGAILLATSFFAGTTWAAGIYKPEGPASSITSYDVLGVKLGMSEADAIASIKRRFPGGSKDANDRPVNLKMSDYVLSSPVTHAKVRAGIRFDLYPETKSNLNFIKVFIHENKVWAIWRDDASGRYDYAKLVSDLRSKYPGAAEIKSNFMVVNGNSISQKPGDPAIDGVHLFEGNCLDFPFIRRGDSDSIRLDPSCRKAFGFLAQPQDKNGSKIMAAGFSQLVDLDAGRSFMRYMDSGAGNINGEKPRTSDSKL